MISLIPYIRETFRRHLTQKQAAILVEFDKLKRVRHSFRSYRWNHIFIISAGLPGAPK